jgi:hypothetical protein
MSLLVENINFKDSSGNSIIDGSGVINITAPNHIYLSSTTGNIEIPSSSLNMSATIIANCNSIKGTNNSDLLLTSISTVDVILRTNTTTRMTVQNSGGISFNNIPKCAPLPSLNTQFANWNQFTNTNLQSYTPEIQASTGTLLGVSYNSRGGRYLQFGNMVWFTSFINMASFVAGTPSATIRITLPVTPPNGGFIHSLSVGEYSGIQNVRDVATISSQISGGIPRSYFILNKKELGTSTSLVSLTFQDIGQNFSIVVTGLYYLF